jgi:hypothetical protein
LSYPAERLRAFLPDREFLEENRSVEDVRGTATRWDEFRPPRAYLEFNRRLWRYFRKRLPPGALDECGRINRTPDEKNCPGGFYFAPLRGRPGQLLLATNHFVIPEMRLCSMHPWASRVSRARLDDSQWRYDELNHRVLTTLDRQGAIGEATARGLLSFLAPDRDYPDYYRANPRSRDGRAPSILGSTSLFNLRTRTIESHYGYFADPWVKTHLEKYVDRGDGDARRSE